MSDQSSPNEDCGESDSGQESVQPGLGTYLIRITPGDNENFTYDLLRKFLRDYFSKWIVGKEGPNIHYHVVVESDDEDVRLLFRTFMYELWPDRPRGWGNKQWNFQVASDPVRGVIYATKHGEYEFEGYDPDFILECKSASFVKPKKSDFTTEFVKLKEDFAEDHNMDIKDFMSRFVQLKSKYGQMVNMHHAYQYALSALFNREPEQVSTFVSVFLNKI